MNHVQTMEKLRSMRLFGMENALRTLLETRTDYTNDELLGYGFSVDFAKVYGQKISDKWHVQRLKNKIITRFVSYDDKESMSYFKKRMHKWEDFHIQFLSVVD